MSSGTILYKLGESFRQELQSLMKGESQLIWTEFQGQDLDIANGDIFILDHSVIDKKELDQLLSRFPDKIILISPACDENNLLDYITKYRIKHLVGGNSGLVSREVGLHVRLMFKNKKTIFKELLEDEYDLYEEKISNSLYVNDLIEKLISPISFVDYFNSPKDYLKVLANELILNALYNNSINTQSRKKNVVVDRPVEIKLAIDRNLIALSVKDHYGTLKMDQLVCSLERSVREKTPLGQDGGAGLGLYLIYNHVNQLIIDLVVHKSCEVICIIDKNKRFKSYKGRITSFHFYDKGADGER